MKSNTCPSCGCDKFQVVDSGRLARCARCRWLLRPDGNGVLTTAIPAATRPAKRGRERPPPFDESRLDRILQGETG